MGTADLRFSFGGEATFDTHYNGAPEYNEGDTPTYQNGGFRFGAGVHLKSFSWVGVKADLGVVIPLKAKEGPRRLNIDPQYVDRDLGKTDPYLTDVRVRTNIVSLTIAPQFGPSVISAGPYVEVGINKIKRTYKNEGPHRVDNPLNPSTVSESSIGATLSAGLMVSGGLDFVDIKIGVRTVSNKEFTPGKGWTGFTCALSLDFADGISHLLREAMW